MSLEFFLLNGYGQFVWPAFFFTFSICSILCIKTYKEYKMYEKLYLKNFRKIKSIRIKDNGLSEVLSKSPIF